MVDLLDPGGNYPVTDDITPVVPTGVPTGFNLVDLLSETMKARAPWMSMAQVSSNVLYQYVEQTRIAFGLSRDPHHIGRALKIATLKMMGLDWNSDIVTDDDYDRLIESVSLYLLNHGSNDFVHYIGYALGFSIEMTTLWTTDYIGFFPGPQQPNIFQYPIGQATPDKIWYPTSHVGLLYEEYASNAPNANQIAALQDIFYRIAPIHLVLEFIGTVVTASVGTIYACTQVYERSWDEAIAEYIPKTSLYISVLPREKSVDIAISQPLYPNRIIPATLVAYSIDTGREFAYASPLGVYWGAGVNPDGTGLVSSGGYAIPNLVNGELVPSDVPPDNYNLVVSSIVQGLLTEKTLYAELSSSGDPQTSNWAPFGVDYVQTFLRWDGNTGWNVSTNYDGGRVTSAAIPSATGCMLFTFRPNSTTSVTIQCGSSSVTVDFDTFSHSFDQSFNLDFDIGSLSTVTSVTAVGITNYGMYPIGAGFYTIWGVVTGSIFSIYPGGITSSGGVDWLDFQFLQGVNYPAPIPSTAPTYDAVNFGAGSYTQAYTILQQLLSNSITDLGRVHDPALVAGDFGDVGAAVTGTIDLGVQNDGITDQLLAGENVDLGKIFGGTFIYDGYTDSVVLLTGDLGGILDTITAVIDLGILPIESSAFVLSPNTYDFLGGVAEVGISYLPLTASIQTNFVGTTLSFDPTLFNYPCGVLLLTITPLYQEWTLDGPQTIFSITDRQHNNVISFTIESSSVVASVYDQSQSFSIPSNPISIGVVWQPNDVLVLVGRQNYNFTSTLGGGFNSSLFSSVGPPSLTWLLQKFIILVDDTLVNLPVDAIEAIVGGYIVALTILELLAEGDNVDLGIVGSTNVLTQDLGIIGDSTDQSVDLGSI